MGQWGEVKIVNGAKFLPFIKTADVYDKISDNDVINYISLIDSGKNDLRTVGSTWEELKVIWIGRPYKEWANATDDCFFKELPTTEESHLIRAVLAAREIQTFLWGEANGDWGLEEWKRMFRKRVKKLDAIDTEKPHAIVEFRKRLLQNAALSIALLGILDCGTLPQEGSDIPSNLPEYANQNGD